MLCGKRIIMGDFVIHFQLFMTVSLFLAAQDETVGIPYLLKYHIFVVGRI